MFLELPNAAALDFPLDSPILGGQGMSARARFGVFIKNLAGASSGIQIQ
jgi:hypothetical protein